MVSVDQIDRNLTDAGVYREYVPYLVAEAG